MGDPLNFQALCDIFHILKDLLLMEPPIPRVDIEPHLCKACQLCVEACPPRCIVTNSEQAYNELGYQWVTYTGHDCTGCGICFYVCPEPGAVTVYKRVRNAKAE
jgi:NAD-dependent dihydropyrimidine dehydrogenase PreA subunit